MQVKRIKCPNCNAVLDVKNSKDERQKHILCPGCKAELLVKFPQPLVAETVIANGKLNDGATQISGGNGTTKLIGGSGAASTQFMPQSTVHNETAQLEYNGHIYRLSEGKNIVGRKAITSTANIQVETLDRYMSRQHISITVTTLPEQTVKALLSNYQNKNQTLVNDQPIVAGDTIRLIDGNRIMMGRTTVTFKLVKQQ